MYKGKKIFVLGMAKSGYEVARLLVNNDCHVLITDSKNQDEEHIKELQDLGVNVIITDKQDELLNETFDFVVKNPGINSDVQTCIKARKLNIPIVNELEVAYHFLKEDVKIVGVTGSNGKTTTTTLIYEILKKANPKVYLGGNIGYPLSSLVTDVEEGGIIVTELSAQQLEDFKDFKVDIGVITNLAPTHLDRYKTFENYISFKKNIYNNGTKTAILNGNDTNVLSLTDDLDLNKIYFSAYKKCDLYIEDNSIYYYDEKIIDIDDIRIKGVHNLENIMCAIAVAKQFNISNDIITDVLSNFSGVEHRLEFVANLNGREFYNDSKATNAKSTIMALNSFNKPIILLLGGFDRGHSFDELAGFMKNVRFIVCFGQTKDRIEKFCKENNIEYYKLDYLKQAVKTAYNLSSEGDIILLSPSCAAYDEYENFEYRGKDFKNIVNELEEK